MTAVIHQPYFLPWMGYFSKLIYADIFIVLDNVNFTKGHYIDRVQIINSQGDIMWLGLPVGQNYKKKCCEIYFSDLKELNKLIINIKNSYAKARFFKENIGKIESIVMDCFSNSKFLSEIDINIVIRIMELLNLKCPEILYGSQLKEVINATDRIISLCLESQCDTLITGPGGSLDIHNLDKIANNGVNIFLQDYINYHPIYYQTRRERLGFAKGLSIVDCIFNEGLKHTSSFLLDIKYKPILFRSAIKNIYH